MARTFTELTFEWDEDTRGNSVLLARKSYGKISISELQEEMGRDYPYNGSWAVVFRTREDGYTGWGGGQEPKGDILELYQIGDGEKCPVCAVVYEGVEYCPHCGERIRSE